VTAFLDRNVLIYACSTGIRSHRAEVTLLLKPNFPSNLSLFLPVQPFREKYFALSEGEIMRIVSPS